MKKIIFFFLGVWLCASSCQKNFLDTKIDTYATPTTIVTDRTTLITFANAFYTSLPNGFNALDGNLFAAASDEAQQTATSSTGALVFNQGGINPNINPDGGSYKVLYDGIKAANYYLQYSTNAYALLSLNRDTVTDAINFAKDIKFVGWYRAEAHITRAYYYSELIKRYGGVQLVTSPFSGVDSIKAPKSSYDDVVNFIVSEIDAYKDSLQVNWRTSSYTDQDGRFNKGAALALKTRVLLYAASPLHNSGGDVVKWQKAAAAANELLTAPGLNLALDGGYGNYFVGNTPLTSNETIFAVRRSASNAPEIANYPISTPGGNSGICPTQNLVGDYEYIATPDPVNPYANRDPRLAATVVTNGSNWNGRTIDESAGGSDDMAKANTSRTGYYLKKFLTDNLNLVQGGTAQHHWVIFRYAEMLLDYAEAMNEAYGPDATPAGFTLSARQALMKVRNRASSALPAVTAASVSDFRDVLKHERKIELAFEDHRYWDLLRWKDAVGVLNHPVQGVSVSKVAGAFVYKTVNVAARAFLDPAMYYYPFAQAEIVNAKGALTQNPGY